MIELPRACLADEIAGKQSFSAGTNDLTQTCLVIARYAGKFCRATLEGLCRTIRSLQLIATAWGAHAHRGFEGRKTRKHLEMGICGEHGGIEVGGVLP